MALRLEESFDVRAPIDVTWSFLAEPRELVPCLPGAELLEPTGPGRWKGRTTVRVGPARLVYEGNLELEERDDGERRMRLRGDGADAADGGTAHLLATIAVAAATTMPAGSTSVHVVATLDITGRFAELGPGMADVIARQLVRQFAECVRTNVEPRASSGGAASTTDESLTLSGAFREHPMLRDTAVDNRTPPPFAPPRAAKAVSRRRETHRISLIPRLWRATIDRLRAVVGRRDAR